ncbi:DUF6035 family protein [Stenotrophomonas rhizophila]|uniref:Competence protein CoiA-like protein n=1 Tax=Stenotrophomonas rhizophila TaxID=216778 RepID=A0AAW5PM26_9GAMM|nr:DUF6035 family protein [Stenotrophomonas rhizophila]MCS4280776.1 hypothetical protein [Stenotrophomonas rhizophila]
MEPLPDPLESPRRVALALKRQYDEVHDRDSGRLVSLAEFLGSASYGAIVADKRVALENDLIEGRERYVCPDCGKAMVLRSFATDDKSEDRFFFRHRFDTQECPGQGGLSPAEICERKFALAKEGAQHKHLKRVLEESLAADVRFTGTQTEARWKDVDRVRWRQPDVQSAWQGRRVAFEVQLSTTFLHVIAERMSFYRRNDGLLLWFFRDLDSTVFKQAEDDIFYSNNRNGFRIDSQTLEQSRQERRFMLHCAWHEPTLDERGNEGHRLAQKVIEFDDLRFDVSDGGVPRAYFYDFDGALAKLRQRREQEQHARREARDQALREAMEAAVVGFARQTDGSPQWLTLRRRFKEVGLELPQALYGGDGPFYHLQAAYSAKHGKPVACRLPNLMGLAHNLFDRHKSALWAFSVMLGHFNRTTDFAANGNVEGWKKKRDLYREGWDRGDDLYAPDRRYDDLLAFLFPDAAESLRRSPGLVERLRRQRSSGIRSP